MRAFYLTSSQTTPIQTKLTTLLARSKARGGSHYIMIDANGDGLTDAIEVAIRAPVSTTGPLGPPEEADSGPDVFRLNTGAGFKNYFGAVNAVPGTRYAINTREDAGIQVADMNQDGVPDLVLLGQAISGSGNRIALRSRSYREPQARLASTSRRPGRRRRPLRVTLMAFVNKSP